jgi:hypothetical protein
MWQPVLIPKVSQQFESLSRRLEYDFMIAIIEMTDGIPHRAVSRLGMPLAPQLNFINNI